MNLSLVSKLSIKSNYSEIIINWVKPLQYALTIETEAGFKNIFGKEKYFNEFLFDNFNNLDELKLSNEFEKSFKISSERFKIYNKLEINQRKRLVIDTRKLLLKLSKSVDISLNENIPSYKNKIVKSKLKLLSNISEIDGIGKVNKEILNKLGLYNINDLINYYPRTYLDYTNKEKIRNLLPDNLYTCMGIIKRFYMYKSNKNSNLSIMNLVIFDETSSIKVTKFFIGKRFKSYTFFLSQKQKFKPGIKVAISGKVKLSEYGKSFIDPQIEILNNNENFNFSGKILPIYSLTDSIPNSSYIKIIRKILYCTKYLPEILNDKQLKDLSLLSKSESLINIHLPLSQDYLKQSKKRLVFDELFLLQLKFLLKRRSRNKKILKANSGLNKKPLKDIFLKNLPFKLTNSQNKVLDEIKLDIEGVNPMSRLLQGDVGSGKTIIAIASMLLMVEKGYQCALMVPTEVLAEQHYKSLIKFINSLFVSVELLTGNTPQKKRKQIFKDLENGQVSVLVGTHALFEEKVIFNSLGLVIIDEQHRFGVSQRNRLLRKGESAHLLSMTATPIPRTLALSIYGDLDISQITELPPGRVPVFTKIISENNLSELYKNVEKEICNGKQAYVILPLIEDSEKLNLNSANKIYEFLSKEVFKKFKVGLLHGKLNSNDKNKILNLFSENKINILVSTTVIEVGIDVPNASIMIIYNSERFGLSQLHQLRGRVGRDSYKSSCYLVTSENNVFSNKRLEVLQNSNDGFYVSEKDLELRGPGQILGYKQSGLPDFVLDNLPQNKELIEYARKEAINVLNDDPNLENNRNLKKLLFEKSDNKFIHEFLN